MENHELIEKGRRCIDLEIAALQATRDGLGESFAEIATTLHQTVEKGNKLILSGVGKNAAICQKLVATFNSIGAPACFLDPVGALHGDLGLCREGDALLAFSNSGETNELLRLLAMISRFELRSIAVTSHPNSALAKLCDYVLAYRADKEACPLELAPTASTSASMAIGDAMAMVLLELKAFGKADFARLHPGGSIGRVLAPRVEDIMRSGERLASLPESATCEQCLGLMSKLSSGCIALTDEHGRLSGVLTDGDIRRYILAKPDFLATPVAEVMTRRPIRIAAGSFAAQALKTFERHSIDDLIVVDAEQRPIGVIDGQDLTKLRMV